MEREALFYHLDGRGSGGSDSCNIMHAALPFTLAGPQVQGGQGALQKGFASLNN